MKSMTGYGRGECAQDGYKLAVEISSVNRKQADIAVTLPRNLEPLEAQVRDEINRSVSRGRVVVRVSLHASNDKAASQVKLNESLAKAYVKEFKRLAKELKLASSDVTLDLLLRAPGVMQTTDDDVEAEDYWEALQKALKQALADLLKMREREGKSLEKDLTGRMKEIQKAVGRIAKRAPEVQVRYREQLQQRIQNAGLELPQVEDERLIKEVVYFADRSDISEEITRLQSHFGQFEDCLKSKEPVGRTLDFLSQEMNREVNTIGSKANDAEIARDVVIIKAELERYREQVQNIE